MFSLFTICLIYILIFFSCFVFTLRFKSQLSKHDGDFPETLIKSFVLFVYSGGLFSLLVLALIFFPYIEQIEQNVQVSSLPPNIASSLNSMTDLLGLDKLFIFDYKSAY